MAAPLAPPEGTGRSTLADKAARMISKVEIENYKTIRTLTLEIGRMNVFIGENGCGKSNILEAIALGSAASRDKLDNEYLVPRGIRVTKPELMRSAFTSSPSDTVSVTFHEPRGQRGIAFVVPVPDASDPVPPRWQVVDSDSLRTGPIVTGASPDMRALAHDQVARAAFIAALSAELSDERASGHLPRSARGLGEALMRAAISAMAGVDSVGIPDFLPFAPENSVLRRFEGEGAVQPLGVRGEGLFQHLQELAAQSDASTMIEINEHLELLDWFERFEVPSRDMASRALRIRDRYLAEGVVFDQKSANEGFLFVLFYLTLFISPHTPRFFAIDNVDAALNPKLCQALMASLVKLAKKHEKQAIVTTHNPALLDGLNLHDDDQRLFVVSRGDDGATRVRRVPPPRPLPGDEPVRLSEAFINGYIGGLPKNF